MQKLKLYFKKHLAISLCIVAFVAFLGGITVSNLNNIIVQKEDETSGTSTTDISSVTAELTDPTTIPYDVPEIDDTVFYINTVSEIGNYEFANGSIVRALGFMSPDDGLMCEYQVVDAYNGVVDGYAQIPLPNGNTAIIRTSKTSVAYVGQFGAFGDSVTDNTSAIQTALNSEYSTIVFPPGEYRVNSSINMENGNKTVVGLEGSLVFTDSEFNQKTQWLLTVRASDVVFNNLAIETRSSSTNKYLTQVGVMNCANVAFDFCAFNVLPMETSASYFNIDVFTGWENVRIDNCELTILSEGNSGTSIMLRDINSRGGKSAQISNNTITKRCLDEILWIYGEKVEMSDISVTGNLFVMEQNQSAAPSPIAITISSQDSMVRNIEFSNNTVDAYASHALFNIANAHDILVEDNDLTFSKYGNLVGSIFTTSSSGGASHNEHTTLSTQNVVVENNRVTVNTSDTAVGEIFNIAGVVRRNSITMNGDVKNIVSRNVTDYSGNDLIVNGNILTSLALNVLSFENNTATINGSATKLFEYYRMNLPNDARIAGNNIVVRDGKPTNSESLLLLNETTMNNKTVLVLSNVIVCGADEYDLFQGGSMVASTNPRAAAMTGNTVVASEKSKARKLYYLNLLDTDQQYVTFGDNNIFGYQTLYSTKNTATEETRAAAIPMLSRESTVTDEAGISSALTATVIDAANRVTDSLSSSQYVANSVWSNNAQLELE